MNMKTDVRVLFSQEGKFETKKRVNRHQEPVSRQWLDQIEEGVKSEELLVFEKTVPIFRYPSQITIHGLFPSLGKNWVHGYKYLFQNKNRSIGVKYGAIDEKKREFIADYLKYIGIRYRRNSSTHSFTKTVTTTKETFREKVEELKDLYDKVDTNLVYGYKNLQAYNFMGQLHVELTFCVNAILEKDLLEFTGKILSQESRLLLVLDAAQKREERLKAEMARKEAEQVERRRILADNQGVIDKILSLGTWVTKYEGPGTFLTYDLNYNNEFVIRKKVLATPPGAKALRLVEKTFDNLQDCLNHSLDLRHGTIYRGTVTGVKID